MRRWGEALDHWAYAAARHRMRLTSPADGLGVDSFVLRPVR